MKVKYLFYSGKSPLSLTIRFRTWSVYSHVAVSIGGTIYESVWPRFRKLEGLEAIERAADASLILNAPFEANEDDVVWSEKQVGKRYDIRNAIAFITRGKDARKSKGIWICSEYAYAFAERKGVKLLERVEAYKVSPGLLSMSPLLGE